VIVDCIGDATMHVYEVRPRKDKRGVAVGVGVNVAVAVGLACRRRSRCDCRARRASSLLNWMESAPGVGVHCEGVFALAVFDQVDPPALLVA
jgi:hypothetical protein